MTEFGFLLAVVLPMIILGGAAQRVTGLGFALVVTPFLVIAFGSFGGVLVVNLLGVTSATAVLLRVWRDIDWRTFVRLIVPAAFGIPAGAWLASVLPLAPLEILIGVLLLASLVVSLFARRMSAITQGHGLSGAAGFIGGAMNASAGVGGPAIAVYAVLTRWDHRSFRATLQPFFFSTGLVSFVLKMLIAPERFPQLDWLVWTLMVLALLLGLVIGDLMATRVPTRIAENAVIALAGVGAMTAVARGMVAILSG